jgi:hypothetical protein
MRRWCVVPRSCVRSNHRILHALNSRFAHFRHGWCLAVIVAADWVTVLRSSGCSDSHRYCLSYLTLVTVFMCTLQSPHPSLTPLRFIHSGTALALRSLSLLSWRHSCALAPESRRHRSSFHFFRLWRLTENGRAWAWQYEGQGVIISWGSRDQGIWPPLGYDPHSALGMNYFSIFPNNDYLYLMIQIFNMFI